MSPHRSWRPYAGGGASSLAILLVVAALLVIVAARRLAQPVAPRRPGTFVGAAIVTAWSLAVVLSYEPIPIVLNVASKIVAFAVAVSLFVPQPTASRAALDAQA